MPGFLHNTCAVMRRETGRITRQPMYFVLMIVLPVVSFAFFALLFNQGAIRNIPSPSWTRTTRRFRARPCR